MYWFKCCRSFIYSISCLVKKCMKYDGVCKFFCKETLQKATYVCMYLFCHQMFKYKYKCLKYK